MRLSFLWRDACLEYTPPGLTPRLDESGRATVALEPELPLFFFDSSPLV